MAPKSNKTTGAPTTPERSLSTKSDSLENSTPSPKTGLGESRPKIKFRFGSKEKDKERAREIEEPPVESFKECSRSTGSTPEVSFGRASRARRSSLVQPGSSPKGTPVRFADPVVSSEHTFHVDEIISEPKSLLVENDAPPLPSKPAKLKKKSSKKQDSLNLKGAKNSSKKEVQATMSTGQQPPASNTLASQQQHRYQVYEDISSIPTQLFDIAPAVERLLSRLLVPDQGIGAAAILDYETSVPDHKKPLDIKDLDAAANGVMLQIHRAHAAVTGLPGIDRTVDEQQEEIDYLEKRVGKQKAMLSKLRDMMRHDKANDESVVTERAKT